ncbi:MAG: TlpA disulfide reductase family protein [Mariniblastus sp.]|nr:TlpA disulfide reductase family protein [Mariniblastus sp.]
MPYSTRFLQSPVMAVLLPVLGLLVFGSVSGQDIAGQWDARLKCPGGAIRFGLELNFDQGKSIGLLRNGDEQIEIPEVKMNGESIEIKIDHYDSILKLKRMPDDRLVGSWRKRRGLAQWVEMECVATRHVGVESENADAYLGRWRVTFSKSKEPAVAVFKKAESTNQIMGTFLTTTGDYRYLAGRVVDGRLVISCFDGAHAFLFDAVIDKESGNQTLRGNFWSANTWHETWTATKDRNAKLPDSFKQTAATAAAADLGKLAFPDLDGAMKNLDDPTFAGKARIIYVFGSWCPNCHDAGKYFSELEERYGDQGLSILGLAFELTGDFERDATQVRKYLKRQGATYPVLIAGVNDKADATRRLTILDRVRSYPTTIFLDAHGEVKAVHTGFTGPATGEAYKELQSKFETLIVGLLNE